ncbi:MAG: hypothetical protein ABIT76_08710 [Chthoniobacterales bacterium]
MLFPWIFLVVVVVIIIAICFWPHAGTVPNAENAPCESCGENIATCVAEDGSWVCDECSEDVGESRAERDSQSQTARRGEPEGESNYDV